MRVDGVASNICRAVSVRAQGPGGAWQEAETLQAAGMTGGGRMRFVRQPGMETGNVPSFQLPSHARLRRVAVSREARSGAGDGGNAPHHSIRAARASGNGEQLNVGGGVHRTSHRHSRKCVFVVDQTNIS